MKYIVETKVNYIISSEIDAEDWKNAVEKVTKNQDNIASDLNEDDDNDDLHSKIIALYEKVNK